MKRLIRISICTLLLVLSACSGAGSAETEKKEPAEPETIHHAAIVIRDYGTVTVELDGPAAPVTVRNFIRLAQAGFYDGLTFHRIIDGFMIQGGKPDTVEKMDMCETITGEFTANGWENTILHVPGTISMARAEDYNSASSQFFIMVGEAQHLDGYYAAFGHVTDGLDIVQKIASDARPTDNNGTIPADEQPVIETVKIID